MTRDRELFLDAWLRFAIAVFVAVGAVGGIAYLWSHI
jgi:hypothetical protein